jgi:hypothetical protein
MYVVRNCRQTQRFHTVTQQTDCTYSIHVTVFALLLEKLHKSTECIFYVKNNAQKQMIILIIETRYECYIFEGYNNFDFSSYGELNLFNS